MMKEKKRYSFKALAEELSMTQDQLVEAIKTGDLPKPTIINRITGECYFSNEDDYNKVKTGLESSPLTEEEFFSIFGQKKSKRGRPKKSMNKKLAKQSTKKAEASASTGEKRRGRPPKAK